MDELTKQISEIQGQRNEEWDAERLGKFTASKFSVMMKRGLSYDSKLNALHELEARIKAVESGEIQKEINKLTETIHLKQKEKRGTKLLEKEREKLLSYNVAELNELYKIAQIEFNESKFGDTCTSYIYEKVAEILTMQPHVATGQAIEWGNEFEAAAALRYEEETGNKIKKIGFLSYNEFSGGSPDGLVGEDGMIEIKCPYNPANHAKSLITQTYYNDDHDWQVQGNLMITGRDWCDFVTYDPRVVEEPLQFSCFVVRRNEEKISAIKERLKEVKEKLDELVNSLK